MSIKPDDTQDLALQIEKLKKINAALIARVEHAHDGKPSAFTLFENAAVVERQVRHQTEDLRQALHMLERSNDALQQAKRMAEAANAMKTTFLASVSHDLLQPLHATRLALSVLNDRAITPSGANLLGQADRSLHNLEEIIKTLLDLSKLDAGVSKPDLHSVAIDGLISDLFAEFTPAAHERGLVLRQRGSATPVHTDLLMLRRILQNLVSNAIRYTRKGGVLLYLREQAAYLRIDIADTGPGIHQDRREAIFEEFQRDDPGVGNEPGSGLGLAIVRRLALALGHEIRLWSRSGFGSVFSILVPRAQDGALFILETERPFGIPFEDVQILIVAADQSSFEPIVPLLKTWGCTVAFSGSHEAASAYLQNAERAPDLLIAQFDEDKRHAGLEVITALHLEAELSIPTILIGADDTVKSTVQNIETLSLPVRPAELRTLIAHLLQPLV